MTLLARGTILEKIEKALLTRKQKELIEPDLTSPEFEVPANLLDTFCEELTTIQGKYIIGDDLPSLVKQFKKLCTEKGWTKIYSCHPDWRPLLEECGVELMPEQPFAEDMEVGVTGCEYLVARSGSVFVSSQSGPGRRMNVFPPVHVVFANTQQLVPFIGDAIQKLEEKYGSNKPSQISMVSGPSRTADIEKTLVMGAHGPKELVVLIHKI